MLLPSVYFQGFATDLDVANKNDKIGSTNTQTHAAITANHARFTINNNASSIFLFYIVYRSGLSRKETIILSINIYHKTSGICVSVYFNKNNSMDSSNP